MSFEFNTFGGSLMRERKSFRSRRERTDFEGVYPMMPSQYYDLIGRRTMLDGEKKLLFAVLEDAIRVYVLNMNARTSNARRDFDEVRNWVNTRGNQDLFTFDALCGVFGIAPDALRQQLAVLSASDLPRRRVRSVGRRVPLTMG
jgi:hypothetical protein